MAESHVAMVRLGAAPAPREQFGSKASTLAFLAQSERVPAGFCISGPIEPGRDTHALADAASSAFKALRADGAELMIVRSSGIEEDLPGSLHAGRYYSHRDVADLPMLRAGVEMCLDSVRSLAVSDYRQSLDLGPALGGMGLIIQRQLEEEYAGVIFGRSPKPFQDFDFVVELTDGPSKEILSGESLGTLFGIRHEAGSKSMRFEELAGEHMELPSTSEVLRSVVEAARRIEGLLGAPQDIEWVWSEGQLFIVQSRPLVEQVTAVAPRDLEEVGLRGGTFSLSMAKDWGLKAAAALFFQRHGMGAKNLIIVEPDQTLEEVRTSLEGRKAGPWGSVVRFSNETNVGLPKSFVPPGLDDSTNLAMEIIRRRREPDWVSLVSDYAYVTNSFEAYVNGDSLLVEHVPGNWEPDNTLAPDLFLWTREGFECFRFSGKRNATIEVPSEHESTSSMVRRVKPLPTAVAQDWARRMVRALQPIRKELADDLPVNVHFVANDADEWSFLNIRPTLEIDVAEQGRVIGDKFKDNRLYPIADESDLEGWDGKSSVVVNFATDRGQLVRIARVAKALSARGATTVHASFGVLSHPAIVLREFGIDVLPLYSRHQRLFLTGVPRW